MKITVTAHLLVPVVTEVEADSEEEAVAVARKRSLGKDIGAEWTLNEEMFQLQDAKVLN